MNGSDVKRCMPLRHIYVLQKPKASLGPVSYSFNKNIYASVVHAYRQVMLPEVKGETHIDLRHTEQKRKKKKSIVGVGGETVFTVEARSPLFLIAIGGFQSKIMVNMCSSASVRGSAE